jgi:hypothetical protein
VPPSPSFSPGSRCPPPRRPPSELPIPFLLTSLYFFHHSADPLPFHFCPRTPPPWPHARRRLATTTPASCRYPASALPYSFSAMELRCTVATLVKHKDVAKHFFTEVAVVLHHLRVASFCSGRASQPVVLLRSCASMYVVCDSVRQAKANTFVLLKRSGSLH